MERRLDLDGDPAKADPSNIPEMSWLAGPNWTTTPGYIHLKSNYQFLVDNLLDITHVTYVHKNTLSGDPREAAIPAQTKRIPDGVRVGRWMIDFNPSAFVCEGREFRRQGGSLAILHVEAAINRLP